jgi:hypothetical protein
MLEKKIKIEYLIDTDVLFEHLIKRQIDGDSFLIRLMKKGLCFTTVLNAAELMLKSTDGEQEKSIRSLLSALKVLGIHSRYCLNVNDLAPGNGGLRDILFMVTAEINKLNIVTLKIDRYKSEKIKIYHAEQILD